MVHLEELKISKYMIDNEKSIKRENIEEPKVGVLRNSKNSEYQHLIRHLFDLFVIIVKQKFQSIQVEYNMSEINQIRTTLKPLAYFTTIFN